MVAPKYALIDKKVGETPLQALERFRATDPALAGVPMTYAGRLDPMASGQLLILIGDECKQREKYDGLDKTYEFEVLLGIGSDTGDILGIPSVGKRLDISSHQIEEALHELVGMHRLPYPEYSSKMIARRKSVHDLSDRTDCRQETREMTVKKIEYLGNTMIYHSALLAQILDKLSRLDVPNTNDFRIDAIRERWKEVLAAPATYIIVRARATVGSGTYIRSLAPLSAQQLGTSGLAYSIHRIHIQLPDAASSS